MNNTVKTILAMIALVLIGFIAGFYTHRYMMKSHLDDLKKYRPSKGLNERILNQLAQDETEKTTLQPVIDKYVTQIVDIHKESRAKREPILEALKGELNPLLDDAQKEKLDRIIKRMKRGRFKKKKKGMKREH